ncbi:unnamed protein product [Clonostachys rosea f. rosea IK726]|uniref:Uncharacterized protein n=1 Tax=Clonostachys rosea f. rosea IK726 TaxID=1349383 RepID=A0ACA9UH04_BIOOC|nr:unnamed protein product [Clonostachys rosea f. rosea IK726]
MPGVILQKISPDSITISMAASASQQPYDSPDEVGMRGSREAREARKAARAKNRQQNASSNQFNGNGHSHSPSRDEYRYQDGDEPYSPTEDSVLQDSMLSQSQQGGAVQQRGPEARRGEQGAMPPGYPGPPGEPNQERPLQVAAPRATATSPPAAATPAIQALPQDPAPTASPVAPPLINRNGRSQAMSNQDAQLRPPASLDDGRQGGPNRRVSRLESPSVLKSVLQPLEKKINEYDRFMTEARSEMAQLDDELRALQERRQQAEDRFLSAKSKHDDYSRQHEDVGRAMRGELVDRGLTSGTMSGPPQHEPIHPQPVQRATPQPMSERSLKPKSGKLRFSLFGKH